MGVWQCFKCDKEHVNPDLLIAHKCNKKLPKNWDYGWQGNTPPIASEYNVPNEHTSRKTPPCEVLELWR